MFDVLEISTARSCPCCQTSGHGSTLTWKRKSAASVGSEPFRYNSPGTSEHSPAGVFLAMGLFQRRNARFRRAV